MGLPVHPDLSLRCLLPSPFSSPLCSLLHTWTPAQGDTGTSVSHTSGTRRRRVGGGLTVSPPQG